jgi:prepilin-type N-terminal cleavage/methylation domain-containing protein
MKEKIKSAIRNSLIEIRKLVSSTSDLPCRQAGARRATSPNSGFTLIEVLVVLAILGVLLTGVVTAVNPAEQFAKTKDSNRERAIIELGKAMHVHSIDNPTTPYPTANNAWQTTLANSGQINEPARADKIKTSSCSSNAQNNICYTTNSTDAAIWTLAESNKSKKRAGGACATSPKTNFAAYVWIASKGRAGLICLGSSAGTVPSYNATLN